MAARVPLDVDLEDKLIYGLTPARLGYLVLTLLAGFALWSPHWAPEPVRAISSGTVVALGAVMAWGRWRARAADRWVLDIAIFMSRRYRVAWSPVSPPRLIAFRRSPRGEAPSSG